MSRDAASRIWSRVAAPLALLTSLISLFASAIGRTPHVPLYDLYQPVGTKSIPSASQCVNRPAGMQPRTRAGRCARSVQHQELEEIGGQVVELGTTRFAPDQPLDAPAKRSV